MDRAQNIAAAADSAYGIAAATNDPYLRGYAAAVEAIGSYLAGRPATAELTRFIVDGAERQERARRVQRSAQPRSVRVTQTLGDVAPGSTVIGYNGG